MITFSPHSRDLFSSPITLDSYRNPFKDISVAIKKTHLSHKDSSIDSLKADLAFHIKAVMTNQRLSRVAAAKLSGTTRARITNLCNGNFQGCSVEEMFDILFHLGNEITVEVTPTWIKKKIRLVSQNGKE